MGMRRSQPVLRATHVGAMLTVLSVLAGPMANAAPPPRGQAPAAPPHTPAPNTVSPPDATGTLAGPASDLANAEKLYGNLDYEHANLQAAQVLSGKGLTHDQLLRALRVLALTDAALGHEDQAREEFVELLTYSADFQVDPNLGPRVTAPFLEARGFWRAQPEKPGVEVVATIHPDGPGTLRVITRDPTHIVKSGTVGYRWGTSVPYITAPLAISGGEGVAVDIPERPGNVTRLDYYAQVFDEKGNAVMEVGNPTAPKSSIIELPKVAPAPVVEKKSIVASPVFWAVAGVVVAGAAVGAYFLASSKSSSGATLTGGASCGTGSMAGTCH